MKKVVIDTNVIFSAILNTNSQIGDLILNSDQYFKFYTAFYLRQEFEKHQGKLLEISKLSEAELEESKHQIFKKINFLSEEQIPFEVWHRSIQYVRDVDMDDIAFVAMSEYLDLKLWTGDKELMNGLIEKGFDRCISTKQMIDWRKHLEEEEE